jgi:hypothetical protein
MARAAHFLANRPPTLPASGETTVKLGKQLFEMVNQHR